MFHTSLLALKHASCAATARITAIINEVGSISSASTPIPTHLAWRHTLVLLVLMKEINHLDLTWTFVPLPRFFHGNVSHRLLGFRWVQQLCAGSWDYFVAFLPPNGQFCISKFPNYPVGASSWWAQGMGHPWPSQCLSNLRLNWSILSVKTHTIYYEVVIFFFKLLHFYSEWRHWNLVCITIIITS